MKLTNIKWDVDTKEELKELPKTMILILIIIMIQMN